MPLQALADSPKNTYDSTEPVNSDKTGEKDAHLFLLVHGLWGNAGHMLTIQEVIQNSLPAVSHEKIVFLRPSSFQFWKTYDGIGRCAENVIADLFFEIETLKQSENLKVTKISILGYSMGGLITRYVIGELYAMGFFEQVHPVFYTSFASPHVGVHFFRKSLFDATLNFLGRHGFGKTGPQFFLKDSESLLVKMARPHSKFMKGLALFEKRLLLANIKNDRSVAFYTSYITEYSPFESLDSVHIKYMKGLPSARIGNSTVWPKFVDLAKSHEVAPTEEFGGNVQEDPSLLTTNKFLRYTMLVFAVLFLFPCYLPLVICLSMTVSLYSVVKVRISKSPDLNSHWAKVREAVYFGGEVDSKNAKVGYAKRLKRWRESLSDMFKGDTSNITESTFENVLQAEHNFSNGPDTLIEETEQRLESSSGAGTPRLSASDLTALARRSMDVKKPNKILSRFFKKPANKINYEANDATGLQILPDLEKRKADYPLFKPHARLPLSDKAQEIVKNLNELQWAKIPVYHDLFNAHGTIVGRRGGMKNPKGICTLYLWGSLLRNHLQETPVVPSE